MAQGKKFNLTEARIERLKNLLGRQYSVVYVANQFGIDVATLTTKMTELGLDSKRLKSEGINTLKAKLYDGLNDIEEPDKKAKISLDFLKHYDKSDDVAVVETADRTLNFNIMPKR